ncbi:hypothetical protein Patl1_02641 [Pistacia atlantica]|uniref:Uncharacterized protein n=1 Tax=Pistacia atlantica TaxID=434234 RepID=A0ACC1C593_9ROSI|nr:hypothetical protein Patl1_02641 [Pistacia atlantica]
MELRCLTSILFESFIFDQLIIVNIRSSSNHRSSLISAIVTEGSSQVSFSSRHSSMLGTSQEAEVGGYRGHTAAAPHYGGQYSSVYGSVALSGAQQAYMVIITLALLR